jgi:multiple sugar transport system substrate-binding protein
MYPRSTCATSGTGRPRHRRLGSRLPALSAIVAVGLLAAACGGSHGKSSSASSSTSAGGASSANAQHPVTITFANWADAETATRPGIEDMISKFEAAHPGITIKSEALSFSDIGHTLVQRVQAGNTPDVAELSGNDTFALAATGALANLDSLMGDTKSQFLPSELTASTYKNNLIAMPWTVNPPGLWYNKTLMQGAGLDPSKPPTTIDELSKDMAAIHAKYPDVLPIGLDTTNRDFSLTSNWSWMKTFDAQPFKDSTATADTSQMKDYLNWMRGLAQKGYLSAGKKIGEFRPLAAQNKVAFVWDQPVLQGVVQKTNKQTDDQFYANWGVEAQPTGPSGKSYSVELGHQLVLFKKSANQQAAFEFMKWLATSPEAVAGYTVKYESSLPPLKSPSADVAKLVDTPVLQAFAKDVLPTVTNPEYGPNYSAAYSPIMAGVQGAVTSSTSIDSIASTMQSGLQSAFK